MSGSTDLEGVHGSVIALDLECARQAARWIAKISADQWSAAAGDEVAAHVHAVCPLPMGMEKEDRCGERVYRLGRGPWQRNCVGF